MRRDNNGKQVKQSTHISEHKHKKNTSKQEIKNTKKTTTHYIIILTKKTRVSAQTNNGTKTKTNRQ